MGLRHERICHERSADYRHAAHVRAAVLPADLGIRLRGMPWSAPEDLGSWPAAFCRRRVLGCFRARRRVRCAGVYHGSTFGAAGYGRLLPHVPAGSSDLPAGTVHHIRRRCRVSGKVTYGVFTLVGFAGVFELDGDEDELEVGEEGLVEPVVAGGGLAVVLHAVEDAFDHVPSLVRLPVVVPWGRAVPLGRHDRRQAERLGQQAGGIPLVRAVHEQVRAHERAGRGHGAAPVACWWTFTLVESMASTRTSTAMIRSSCNAVNRRSIAPFPDQRSTLMNRSSVMPYPCVHIRQSSHKT